MTMVVSCKGNHPWPLSDKNIGVQGLTGKENKCKYLFYASPGSSSFHTLLFFLRIDLPQFLHVPT
ncbi:hypothetical protein V2S85_06650 [Novosphingobium resinovorum]|nr:hypothetical protein [Novosphingobium resinovorum]